MIDGVEGKIYKENEKHNISLSDLRNYYVEITKQNIERVYNLGNDIAVLRENYKKNTVQTNEKKNLVVQEKQTMDAEIYQQNKASQYVPLTRQRSPKEFICDLLLLAVVFIVAITSFMWFATPITELGGVVSTSETLNLYSLLYADSNSLFVQAKTAIESFASFIENIESVELSEEDVMPLINTFMTMIRLGFIAIPALYIAIKTIINVVSAPICFIAQKSVSLRKIAVKAVSQNLIVYVCFAFFGSISGGIGVDAYYIGYTVGKGMTLGVLGALFLLFVVAMIVYSNNRFTAKDDEFSIWRRAVVATIGYVGIAVALTLMRIYSISAYVFSSSLTAAILSLQTGFEIKAFIFPVLNLFLLIACLSLVVMVKTRFNGTFVSLLNFGDESVESIMEKSRCNQSVSKSFVPMIVIAILSVFAVLILRNPNYGYGWSVDIYSQFVWIFAISAVCQAICSFVDNKN